MTQDVVWLPSRPIGLAVVVLRCKWGVVRREIGYLAKKSSISEGSLFSLALKTRKDLRRPEGGDEEITNLAELVY